LSNLKAHLYKQLLISLRLLNSSQNEDILIREMMDYARVLYNKGLYRQSLDMLEKAKERAGRSEYHTLALEILEFEKHLESQYVTGSIEGRAEQLTEEAHRLYDTLARASSYSNLSLRLYGHYLKDGHVRDSKDLMQAQQLFQDMQRGLSPNDYQSLDFLGKVHFCQAHVWYYHIIQDFPQCYRYAQKWIDLFDSDEAFKTIHAALYLKGLHNLLNALFNTLQYSRFVDALGPLQRFPQVFDLSQSANIEGLYYLYWYIHAIKRHFMEGTFSEGLDLVPGLMDIIDHDRYNWDERRIMIFYYRIACLYFGSGDNSTAIDYLNLIINPKNPDYRADIQCFARILNLIAHFELGNAQLVEYQVKSVYRFLSKMEDLHAVQREIFSFLRKTPRMRKAELKREFLNLRKRLSKLEADPYERRPFLYLDIISWLDSKIEGKPVQDIIRHKFLQRS
jgi:hypothetical protein